METLYSDTSSYSSAPDNTELMKLNQEISDLDSLDVDSIFTTTSTPTVESSYHSNVQNIPSGNVFSKYRKSRFFSPLRKFGKRENENIGNGVGGETNEGNDDLSELKRIKESIKNLDNHIANFKLFDDNTEKELRRLSTLSSKEISNKEKNNFSNIGLYESQSTRGESRFEEEKNDQRTKKARETSSFSSSIEKSQRKKKNSNNILFMKTNDDDDHNLRERNDDLSSKYESLKRKFDELTMKREKERRMFDEVKMSNNVLKIELEKMKEENIGLMTNNEKLSEQVKQISQLLIRRTQKNKNHPHRQRHNKTTQTYISSRNKHFKEQLKEEKEKTRSQNHHRHQTTESESNSKSSKYRRKSGEMIDNVQHIRDKMKQMTLTNTSINNDLRKLEDSISEDNSNNNNPIHYSSGDEENLLEEEIRERKPIEEEFDELRGKFRRFMGKYNNLNRLHQKSRKLNEYYKSKITYGYKRKIRSMRKRIDGLRKKDERMFEKEIKKLIRDNNSSFNEKNPRKRKVKRKKY